MKLFGLKCVQNTIITHPPESERMHLDCIAPVFHNVSGFMVDSSPPPTPTCVCGSFLSTSLHVHIPWISWNAGSYLILIPCIDPSSSVLSTLAVAPPDFRQEMSLSTWTCWQLNLRHSANKMLCCGAAAPPCSLHDMPHA